MLCELVVLKLVVPELPKSPVGLARNGITEADQGEAGGHTAIDCQPSCLKA